MEKEITMNKRGVGVVFCFISAMLFSVRYLAAAIFMSGVLSWDAGLFNAGLEYVGTPLLVFSILSLLVGIVYLILAEVSKKKA